MANSVHDQFLKEHRNTDGASKVFTARKRGCEFKQKKGQQTKGKAPCFPVRQEAGREAGREEGLAARLPTAGKAGFVFLGLEAPCLLRQGSHLLKFIARGKRQRLRRRSPERRQSRKRPPPAVHAGYVTLSHSTQPQKPHER